MAEGIKNSTFEGETLPRFGRAETNDFFDEANKLLEKGDRTSIAQACEKFYKVTEEIVKILAAEHLLEEWRRAEEQRRWTTQLLFGAVGELMRVEGKLIQEAWLAAWALHTAGFHENLLGAEEVSKYISSIRELVEWFNRRNIHRNITT
ncbi:MAG: PaREP1 family protein [Methanophagales archaeon]|nr:PaREP1 family protein [Methanophagales archaeon]